MVQDNACADSDYPIDEWMQQVRQLKPLPEQAIKKLSKLLISYLFEESNVQPVSSPATIWGSIHGQFYDLMELFDIAGHLETTQANYVFLGNYVNRGIQSVEMFTYLMLLKAKFRSRITLRGNHEIRQITQVYGLYDEVLKKYYSPQVWKHFCDVFDYLPLAATIDGKVLCVHAGLSPELPKLDDIQKIKRNMEIPPQGPFADLVWSDPEPIQGWKFGTDRSARWVFGADVVHQFNHFNGLDLICRSHEMVQEGYKYNYGDDTLVTIWSAPNYREYGNVAAVLKLDINLDRKFQIFKPSNIHTLRVGKSCKDEDT